MVTIKMPSLGESVAEGEIGKWLVKEGDFVQKNQALVEVLSDKADSEVNASTHGVVTKIHAQVGSMVPAGGKLCDIDETVTTSAGGSDGGSRPSISIPPSAGGSDGGSRPSISVPPKQPATPSTVPPAAATVGPSIRSQTPTPAETRQADARAANAAVDVHASPAVRKFAREQNLDLAAVRASAGGRVSMDDAKRAATGGRPPTTTTTVTGLRMPESTPGLPADNRLFAGIGPLGAFKLPPYTPRPGDEVIPFTRRRRIIADHMMYSKLNAPHVVTFSEVDLQSVAKLRNEHKAEFEAAGLNLTYLAFVCCATAKALTEYRELNARVMDEAYVLLREVNLGVAVDTREGLVVPVIRHADELSVRGMARAIDELARKARDNELTPDDLAHKTFTVSNPGKKGNLVGGAIISQPNVGILRIGEIKKRPVVVEQDGEDAISIHPVMYIALSYDHRIVDGVHANSFLWRVHELLENADFEL